MNVVAYIFHMNKIKISQAKNISFDFYAGAT